MTFWDRDKERYTNANSEIVSITFKVFQKGAKKYVESNILRIAFCNDISWCSVSNTL